MNLRVLTLGNLKVNSSLSQLLTVAGGAIACLLFVSMPVLAHHPMKGSAYLPK
jgi:hypothetical protein